MRRTSTSLLIAIAALSLLSIVCSCSAGTPTPVPTAVGEETVPPENIGTIRREETLVRYGPTAAALDELVGTRPLLTNSALQVTEGGEALLDFEFGLVLRAFNNSDMSVSLSADPSSFLARFFLESSVVTGELAAEGEQILWTTPGGEEIVISGTEFWIGYDGDPERQETIVGNFNGTVEIAGYGSLPPGRGVILPAGIEFPITVTRIQFENGMRSAGNPTVAQRDYTGSGEDALLIYGGEPFSPADMRDAMLYAVPWREIFSELTGQEDPQLSVLAPTQRTGVQSIESYPYNEERAFALFQEYGYQPSPGDDVWLPLSFILVVPEEDPYMAIGESAVGYYENFGFDVALEMVPPTDYFPIVQTLREAGETFWAIGPAPETISLQEAPGELLRE